MATRIDQEDAMEDKPGAMATSHAAQEEPRSSRARSPSEEDAMDLPPPPMLPPSPLFSGTVLEPRRSLPLSPSGSRSNGFAHRSRSTSCSPLLRSALLLSRGMLCYLSFLS